MLHPFKQALSVMHSSSNMSLVMSQAKIVGHSNIRETQSSGHIFIFLIFGNKLDLTEKLKFEDMPFDKY